MMLSDYTATDVLGSVVLLGAFAVITAVWIRTRFGKRPRQH